MPAIIVPSRQIIQPQGLLRSARDDALWLVCAGASAHTSDDPTGNPNLVSDINPFAGHRHTTERFDIRPAIGDQGAAFFSPSYRAGLGWPLHPSHAQRCSIAQDSGGLTIAWYGRFYSDTSINSFINRASSDSLSNAGQWTLRVYGDRLLSLNAAYSVQLFAATEPYDTELLKFFTVVVDSPNQYVKMYVDGKLLAEGAVTLPATTGNNLKSTTFRARLGTDPYTYGGMYGAQTYVAGAFASQFSESEVQELAKNPYQLIRQEPTRLYFDLAAPTGPSPILTRGDSTTSAATSSSAAVTQTHLLAADGVTQLTSNTIGAVTQTHLLAGDDSAQSSDTTDGAVTQTHVLTGADAAQSNATSSGAISSDNSHTVTGESTKQLTTTTTASVAQRHITASSGSVQSASSTSGAATTEHMLVGAGSAQRAGSTPRAIVQLHFVSGTSTAQATRTGSAAITQRHLLSGTSTAQITLTSEGVAAIIHALRGADTGVSHRSTSGALAQAHQLTGDSTVQRTLTSIGAIYFGDAPSEVVELLSAITLRADLASLVTQRLTFTTPLQ